uniref:Uncharacterized protein n=1 Tax=Chloropicon laureae TaxID=464258 RepID=A0A7S2Z117_9CHLO
MAGAGEKGSLDLGMIGEGARSESVHWLPCHINHDGETNAEVFFHQQGNEDEGAHADPASASKEGEGGAPERMEKFLRGRHLKGAKLELPEGYSAALLEKRGENGWKATAKADITYWNHSTNPGENDSQQRTLEVLRVASTLHAL